jgi:hypothetical protein
MSSAPPDDAIVEESRRARQLRTIVDLTSSVIAQGGLSRAEADALVAATRRRALELFPGKDDTFDLVLAPRFARLIREFVAPPPPPNVLPFRRN